MWFEYFGVLLFYNWQHTSCILVCCALYVTFSFWFILNFYHVSASYVSLTVKNRHVYCVFENTIGDLFLNMFSSSSYILYIFLYPYVYIYIIHTTLSMLNLQGNKSEMYTKVNYFSRCIYYLYDLNVIIMTYGLFWLLKTILNFSKPLLWVVSWSIYWCNDVSHKMVRFVSGPCVFKFCFLFIFTLIS